jgi:hypothetical protein
MNASTIYITNDAIINVCSEVVTIINERRGKSPYKRRAKQDETLINADNVSTEGLQGQELGKVKLRLRAADMDDLP